MDDSDNQEEKSDKFEPKIEGKTSEELLSYQELYENYEDLKQQFEEEKIKQQTELDNQKEQVNQMVAQLTQKNILNEQLSQEILVLKEASNDNIIKKLTEQIRELEKEKLAMKEEGTKLEDDSYKLLIKCSKLEEQLTTSKKELEEGIANSEKIQESQDQQLKSIQESEQTLKQQIQEMEELAISVKTENALLKTDKDVYYYKLQQLIKEIKSKKLDVNIEF